MVIQNCKNCDLKHKLKELLSFYKEERLIMSSNIDSEIIKTEIDILNMLDNLLENRDKEWWNNFYSDKAKPIPFLKIIPDEKIITYFNKGFLSIGKALDISCGKGRNSFYLAQRGFEVYGVDFSKTSIECGMEIANKQSLNVKFLCQSIFDFQDKPESFDFIYDSGCLHHIKPHRRYEYLKPF